MQQVLRSFQQFDDAMGNMLMGPYQKAVANNENVSLYDIKYMQNVMQKYAQLKRQMYDFLLADLKHPVFQGGYCTITEDIYDPCELAFKLNL